MIITLIVPTNRNFLRLDNLAIGGCWVEDINITTCIAAVVRYGVMPSTGGSSGDMARMQYLRDQVSRSNLSLCTMGVSLGGGVELFDEST